jgi:hypothetical protein
MSEIWRPVSERRYSRVMKLGMSAEIVGILILSVTLFASVPIVLTLSLSVGALLIVVGLLSWLWGLVWGRE